jgi:hypothetical protein
MYEHPGPNYHMLQQSPRPTLPIVTPKIQGTNSVIGIFLSERFTPSPLNAANKLFLDIPTQLAPRRPLRSDLEIITS